MSSKVKKTLKELTQRRKETQRRKQQPESDSDVPNEEDCRLAQQRRRSLELKTKQDLIDQARHDKERKAYRCSSTYRRIKAVAERKWRRAMDWQVNRKLTPIKEGPSLPSFKFTDIYKTPHRSKMFVPEKRVSAGATLTLNPPPYTPDGSGEMEGVLLLHNPLPPYTPPEGNSEMGGPSTPLARRTSIHSLNSMSSVNSVTSMASSLSLSGGTRKRPESQQESAEDLGKDRSKERAKERQQMYQEIFKKMPIRTQDEKRAEFVEQRQIDRAVRFYQNRGLSVAPLLNDGKSNFGNDLRITHVYSRDLDRDWDQSIPMHKQIMFQLPNGTNVRWITVEGVAAQCRSYQFNIVQKASDMVERAFKEKGVELNLHWHAEECYVSDILVDRGTDEPIGAIQYAFMKKFVWLDTLTVDKPHRGTGIARMLLQRCVEVARARGKDILLLAIPDVVEMYKKFGFEIETRYPKKEALDHPLMTLRVSKD